jgi:hypothetical protein
MSFVNEAISLGLEAFSVNIYDDELTDNIELNDVGYLIAMTGSDAVNEFAVKSFSKNFGEHGSYRLASSVEALNSSDSERQRFFTPNDDYINLSEAFRDNPVINEVKIDNEEAYNTILEALSKEEKSIPLFIEKEKGIYLISEFEQAKETVAGLTLSYLGRKMDFKKTN